MEQDDHESFIRWQEITRNHFSSIANLILALATGLLAFQSNLLLEHKLASCCAHGFATASLIVLVASVAFGLWCLINRLRDFRLTTMIARCREKVKRDTELQDLREESKSLGKFTWVLFWTQLTFFGIGAAFGAVAVIIEVWSK